MFYGIKTVGGKQCRSTFTIHKKVRGFQQEQVKYSSKNVEIRLKRTKHQCPHCGSTAVTVEPLRRRRIRGESLGSCRNVVLEFTIHRLYCHRCHHRELEHILEVVLILQNSSRKLNMVAEN